MKFIKLVKAGDEEIKLDLVDSFYQCLVRVIKQKAFDLPKEDILSALEEATLRLEESIDVLLFNL